ncbi:MAG: hypothetical protein KDA17_05840 [Candidatus Saccharibacteria bacterium]|nr:hypothetical protein [Candidatus Saccharibacteria bacterium]
MKTSIETINNHLVTVIRKPFDVEWVREQLAMGAPLIVQLLFDSVEDDFNPPRIEIWKCEDDFIDRTTHPEETGLRAAYIISKLPALPKHPTPEDAALLYRYASEGLFPRGYKDFKNQYIWHVEALEIDPLKYKGVEITHATDTEGNRVEVAIQDGGE